MTEKSKKERIEQILTSLGRAASGDYSKRLDFSSQDDDLGRIAEAVNKLLKETEKEISAIRQAPMGLSADGRRYRHILDSIEESYFEVDLKGHVLFFNDSVVRDLGYTPAELRGISFRELVDGANAKKVYEAFHQVYLTGLPIKGFDWEILKKNKDKIDVESSVALVHDEAGKPVGFRGVVRDISLRVRAQNDLRKSEEKYRTILEIMGEGYFEADIHGVLTFANDAGCTLVGYRREELIGQSYRRYSTPESLKLVYDAYRSIYRGDLSTINLDYDVIGKDGSVKTHQQTVALMRDASGKPCGFRILVRDITERKKAEDALRKSEEKYRSILANMEETYLETDLKGNFLFFNDSLCRVLGYARQELQDANYRLISPADNIQGIQDAFNEIYRTGRKRTFPEYALLTRQGTIIHIEMSVSLMRSPSGEPVGFSGIGRDVTEKLRNEKIIQDREKHLRMITDNISDIIWTMDLNLRWTYLSPSVQRMTGFSPEEIVGLPLKAMLPAEVYAGIEQNFAAELVKDDQGLTPDRQRAATFEMPLMRKNGTELWVEISANFNRDTSGKPFEIVGVTRDITERKKVQKALEESEAIYRKTLESTSDGVSIIQDDQYVYFNEQFLQTLGIPKGYPVGGSTLGALIHPDDRPKIKEPYLKRLQGEPTPGKHEIRVLRPDGKLLYLLVTSVDTAFNGQPAILSFMQNITERKNAENALAESEKRYRTMTENVNDIVWIFNFNLQITYVSPSNIRLTGFAPEEVQNKPLDDFIAPDSLAFAAQVLSDELARETGGQPVDLNRYRTLQIEVYSKKGDNVWLEVNATFNRDANGQATEILAVGRNITERRNMERALAESEKRYRIMAENVNDIIWTINLNLQITYVSPSSARVTGYTQEETQRTPLDQLLTAESFAFATGRLADELALEASGQPFDPNRAITLEIEAIHKGGGTIWLEITGTFNRNERGEITEILVVGRDITKRKKTEQALADSEKLYRMIVENMQDVIWIMDFNLQYKYRSPSSMRITGYTTDEIMSIPTHELMTPKSYDLAQKILLEELESEQRGLPVDPHRVRTMELEIYKKGGGTIWIEITATFNRDREGNPFEILLAARDISARKKIEDALRESEQRYRMIVENMHEIIWTTDLNLRNTYMSLSCFPLTGYTPEELLHMPPDQVLTPESAALAASIVLEEIARESSGEPVDPLRSRTMKQEILRKDGGTVWLEVTGTFIRDESGKATGMLMAGRDITARMKAEEDKDRLEAQLMQAQKMEIVGRLAGGVAHDFNNMLSVILGYVDLAKLRLAKQHPVLKDIAEIEKAAIRSRDITMQLLAFSRKQIIEPKVIDLNDLVAHTQKALTRLIGEDIELLVLLKERLWPVKFDPSQIEQILINLAVNARDAMPQGGKLTIETANSILDASYCENHVGFTPGDYVRLSFSDDGVGMNKETLQHIFEPFFTTKDVGKGTGLGLATVYGIVKQNDSFINVYSEPAHGTTFSIYIPRTGEEKSPEDASEEEPRLAGHGNILLVEDDAMVLQITTGMLESMGYTVTATSDPQVALAVCKDPAAKIDLIISDVVMPGMSGKELRDRFVEMRPDINFLFMSGYTADVIAHHGVLEEGVQFLQKPFTIKSLAGKIKEVLARSV